MSDNCAEGNSSPLFVAYVYPGWHPSSYRRGVDEWGVLDGFKPYFEGHQPPPRPLHGLYDDSKPETALRQMETASEYGIDAFTYFLYYQPDQFVLSEPVQAAISMAPLVPGFKISLTWCIRLPHDHFPIRLQEKIADGVASAEHAHSSDRAERSLCPEQKAIEDLSLEDIEQLLDSQALNETLLLIPGGY